MKAFILLTFLLIGTKTLQSQTDENWALGVSGIYDFQTNGFGLGARGYLPLTQRLAVSPQFAYFLPFNTIHELYAGAALQFSFIFIQNWHIYALGAGYYNRWLNSSDFVGSAAKPNNFAAEAGLGITKTYACMKPFGEIRYDQKWKEFHLQVGLLFSFGDCFAPHGRDLCPAY